MPISTRVDGLRKRVAALSAPPRISLLQIRADRIQTRFYEALPALVAGMGLRWVLGDNGGVAVSLEQIRLLEDADVLFTMDDVGSGTTRANLEANPLWRDLKAVKANRVHGVDAAAWLAHDPKAIHIILDDIERHVIVPAERH